MQKNKIRNIDDFIFRLEELDFFERALFDITVNATEFFRDPSFWREFIHLTSDKIESQVSYKIWMPDCASGEELYSLCIVLKEEKLLDKVKILASNLSKEKIEYIKKGTFDEKREDVNSANYKRTNLNQSFEDYITPLINNKFQIDTSLLQDVEFIHTNNIFNNPPQGIKFILFRNSMIYYNKTLQNDVVELLYNSLLPGGHLAIGNKETLNILESERKFRTVSETERIYQKISK
jgi:chemotaxis protein methyltransferase CheR